MFCFVFLLNLIWIPAQFAYRCILLCYPERKRALFRVVTIVVVTWSAIGLAVICPVYRSSSEFQAVGTRILQNIGWPVESNGTEPVFAARLVRFK
ncbi:hypothetical protein AAVH_17176 [Aphelenchoides avenae]|nr:hypothetical protein AAVH_17176 [Aphelenchus avenae]